MVEFPQLGRLETLKASDVWRFEALTFTPWLSHNLGLLAEALNIEDLILRGTEVSAGDFRIDILAEDEAGSTVIIENQFGKTDHNHLGQLITYAASQVGNVTVIWVAERFREEHRAAIDWLNSSTIENFNFFAVELEALRIGDSLPAPFFNLVAKPNDWTKVIGAAARQSGTEELAQRYHDRIAYWRAFGAYLAEKKSPLRINRENRFHWFSFPIGRAGFSVNATLTPRKSRVGVELYMSDDPDKRRFNQLLAHKAEVEAQIGKPLEWQPLLDKRASRIATYLNGVNAYDPDQYPPIQEWMLDNINRFRSAFEPLVRNLNLTPAGDGVDLDEE